MSEPSMVCNGHKESTIEKCSVNEFISAFDKRNNEPTNIKETQSHKADSMTIGLPFKDFDHLYASSVEETGNTNIMNFNVARTNLDTYHLNIIEEQAKIIDAQNKEICKLKRQNESLIARIERMNRRLNLNQCSRKTSSRTRKSPCQLGASDSEKSDTSKRMNYSPEDPTDKQVDDTFPGDIQLMNLKPFSTQTDSSDTNSEHKEQLSVSLHDSVYKTDISDSELNDNTQLDERIPNKENMTNFRLKFRRNSTPFSNDRRKRNKVVRFVEENKSSSIQNTTEKHFKRNCTAKTVDEQFLTDDAVLFLKSLPDNEVPEKPAESSEQEDTESVQSTKRKTLKIPILVTSESYYTSSREDTCYLYDPVTYTPTSLEVPSFRTIEKENPTDTPDVPKDYYEDVRLETAKERHLRFEIGERKRKKWDVQRIRELRQNERLKEKLRRRKGRFSKVDSPKQHKAENPHEHHFTLFPDIKTVEKILITDAVPITALGTSIPKVPSWGTDFRTDWRNNGSVDVSAYEDPVSQPHHKDTRSRQT